MKSFTPFVLILVVLASGLFFAGCSTGQVRQITAEDAAKIALRKAEGKATPQEEKQLREFIEAKDATAAKEGRR